MADDPVVTRTALVLAAAFALVGGAQGRPRPETVASAGWRAVSRDEILAAMQRVGGYELTATANGPRLQAEVLLLLARQAQAGDPARRPLFVGHREWYEAYLERTGLPPARAPIYVRKPFEIGQDLVLDYRSERVLESVQRGPQPQLAANVRIFWADVPGRARSYSYDDTLSSPTLRVTQKQEITYRLLDYGDRLWYAEIAGLYGRPTSGALGLVFDLIGEARVLESRSAFSSDGRFQVTRGRATKLLIDRTETVTVFPEGHADRGVPANRPDLAALESRLKEPLAARFRPFTVQP
jgi:hypothetical protein